MPEAGITGEEKRITKKKNLKGKMGISSPQGAPENFNPFLGI